VQHESERQEPVSETEDNGEETLAESLSQYAGIMDSVMSWSEDGESKT
jgi:hypothetical protein